MRFLRPILLLCAAMVLASAEGLAQTAGPRPPCATGWGEVPVPRPDYAAEDAPPAVEVWHDVTLSVAAACGGELQGRMKLVVALSARFRFAGSLDDLAARAGAISKTVGLVYWSTNEQKWRPLISQASALRGPFRNWRDGSNWRVDFTAQELRAGKTLWFLQNDTRSTGANLYRLRGLESASDRLVLESMNETPIAFTAVTLFDAHALLSLQAVQQLDGDLWGYYGLAAVRYVPLEGYETSMVNRAAALFRFLQGKPGDAGPPLAK